MIYEVWFLPDPEMGHPKERVSLYIGVDCARAIKFMEKWHDDRVGNDCMPSGYVLVEDEDGERYGCMYVVGCSGKPPHFRLRFKFWWERWWPYMMLLAIAEMSFLILKSK